MRVGAGEEDDGEEGADAPVEHGGADLGQRLPDALISTPCKQIIKKKLASQQFEAPAFLFHNSSISHNSI